MDKKEEPVLSLIQKLRDGQIDPKTIGKDLRQRCVEVFIGEGYSTPQIAQILAVCEKTIKRDIEAIREKNLLAPDANLAKKIVGEMVMNARIHHAYLMRLARSNQGKTSEKAQAEYYAHRVGVELIEKLQSLGYLPSQAQAIVGDLYHHIDTQVLDRISAQVIETEEMISQAGEVPDLVHEELKKAKELTKKMNAAKADKNKEDKDGAQ